jgi:hypothetical protein
MAQKAYANHVALREKLKRLSKVHPVIGVSYSALATLILDTALQNNGYIPKEAYYNSTFKQPGFTYSQWISLLIKAGVILPFKEEDQKNEKSDWIRFKPGPVTLPYVNKEKAHLNEMASMRDVYESEARVNAQKADRSELEQTKRELQETKSKFEFASTKLEETSSKLNETNRVVAKIAEAVQKLQEASTPPVTKKKLQLQKKAREELEEHTRSLPN